MKLLRVMYTAAFVIGIFIPPAVAEDLPTAVTPICDFGWKARDGIDKLSRWAAAGGTGTVSV